MSWISTGPWPASLFAGGKSSAAAPSKSVAAPQKEKEKEKEQTQSSDANFLFEDVPEKISFPDEEVKIQAFWESISAFETSLELSKGRPRYTFYDGPPFATGLPHYGHLLAGSIKDIVTRYAHQTGHYVERRFGWDCHGLPVEYEIDKTLGIKSKEDVMKIGIAKYNAECRSIVMRYSKEWEATVKRMGRWIDFKNDYKTLNTPFMETVWWVFKQLFDKKLVYRGFKVMPYSTGCTTPLSNFEANQNYKDVIDPAVVVNFPTVDDPNTCFLIWTTTPWTLPSNLALCVNETYEYVKVLDKKSGKKFILLEKRLVSIYKDPAAALGKEYDILEKIPGAKLKGIKYIPPFDYFYESKKKDCFVVVADNYVTDEAGTGIVHQAPAFGEDDYRVCIDNKVIHKGDPLLCPVDDKGHFTSDVTHFAGKYVKDADKEIIKHLKDKGRLVNAATLNHSYPFCWRSDTPLLYKAVPAWFIQVESLVDKLLANNLKTYWVPDFVQEKRFHNWLRDAKDWNISRNRYWGTPIPLWVSDDFEEVVCVGSIEELKELSGHTVSDMHRENIDHITIPSKKGKGTLRRVEEVFDCWFESGSMPYAQQHYPFENKEEFEKSFPADFIAEGLDQTRGWFYTLMVISTALFDQPPFKNLIVNGLVLAADGKKMSKRLKNYPDPSEIITSYGADALRLYLINSPVVRAEPLKFKKEGVFGVIKDVFLPWFNAYRFFVQNSRRLQLEEGIKFTYNTNINLTNVMDKWILAAAQSLIKFVDQEMNGYRLYTVVPRLVQFIDELTNWYVRFNRKRLKGENGTEDCISALQTLFEVLYILCRIMAPFTPFLTEMMYQNLKHALPKTEEDVRSIHFVMLPKTNDSYFNNDIERAVGTMQKVIELGRVIRERKTISLKNPLPEAVVVHSDPQVLEDVKSLQSYVLEELNVKSLVCTNDEKKYGVKYRAEPDPKVLGKQLGKELQAVTKEVKALNDDQVKEFVKTGTLTVLGHTFTTEQIIVTRYFEDPESTFEANSVGDLLLLVNCVVSDDSLVHEGLAREVINRVQKTRKEAKINATDDIIMYYELLEDPGNQLKTALDATEEFVKKTLKRAVVQLEPHDPANFIYKKEQEVRGSKFNLVFVKP